MKKIFTITGLLFIVFFSINSALAQAPTITNISPVEGPVGTLVTVTGTNLDNLIALSIAGVNGLEVSNDGNTLVGFVMPGATTGTVDVTTSFFGSTSVSSSQSFTVNTPSANPALQLGADIDGEAASDQSGRSVSLSADGQRLAIGATFNDGTDTDAGHVRIYDWSGTAWVQLGSNINGETADDRSGQSVSLSADGQRVAIGAVNAGHVRIYEWSGTAWIQVGVNINEEVAGDQLGYSVSLSANGQFVAIGAPNNNSFAGHVRIYEDVAGTWTQIGNDIDGEAANDRSGWSVSLSADGQRVAIGAPFNNLSTGHVRIYEWSGTAWGQLGTGIDGEAAGDQSGYSVSLSANGRSVAIGAINNNGSTGHVRVYEWSGTAWGQLGANIDGVAASDLSGWSLSLSADGERLAIGARAHNGGLGHVRIFDWSGTAWGLAGTDIDGEAAGDQSGFSVSLSADGQRVAIGAPFNAGNGASSGHVRAFQLVNPLNLITSTPASNATNIARNANITLTFNFPVVGTTANATNINISGQLTGIIAGTFSGGGSNTITFDPTNDFKAGEVITITVTSGLQSTFGNLAAAKTFQFTTATASAPTFICEKAISATRTGNALADLDGDGDVDVISAANSLVWLQNDGAGNFVEFEISPNGAGLVTAQDVDGDGDMDIVASYTDSNDVTWFENDGNETFSENVIELSGGQQTDESLFALDFDLDGDIDILVSKSENPDIVWYENDGSESFSRNLIPTNITDTGDNTVFPIDMDGDGDIDFLNNYEFTNEISWYENDGFQSFTQNIISTNGNGTALYAMDMDGDGDVDILASTSSNTIVWYENNGSQSFTENTIDASTPTAYLNAADIDGDGDVDVLSASAQGASSTIDIYRNNGSEVFSKNTLATGNIGLEVKVADMDNDGDVDVIGSFFFGNTLLFENTNGPLNSISSTPSRNELNVAANANISVAFDANIVVGDVHNGTTGATQVFDDKISVFGSLSGYIGGTWAQGSANSVVFTPSGDFKSGETISVSIHCGLDGANGTVSSGESFKFTVATGAGPGVFPLAGNIINASVQLAYPIDVDGDGDMDVVGAKGTEAVWYENDGNQVFSETVLGDTFGDLIQAVHAVDVDRDGDIDLLFDMGGSLSWFENDGSQNFTENFPSGGSLAINSADIDNDGDVDLLVYDGDEIAWLENDGNQDFTSRNIDSGFSTFGGGQLYPVDMDDDGDLDILLNLDFIDDIIWYENDGSEVFTQRVITTSQPTLEVRTVKAIDFDADGDIDLVAAFQRVIVWFENDGSEVFTEQLLATGTGNLLSARSAQAADIDGDGDVDVIGSFTNETVLYENIGSGFFNTEVINGDEIFPLFTTDIDLDGDLDLLTTPAGGLVWYEQAPPPPVITAINPIKGNVGTEITISGSGFNTSPANNLVFFGATTAVVNAATSTEITVIVPPGATYDPITVLDLTSGRSASSLEIFTPTFIPNKNSLEITDFDPRESFATDGRANTFVVNDFDGDGKNDIIIRVSLTFPALPETSIFRNTSTAGNISFAPKVDIPSDYTTSITADDLDGDGKPELIFTEFTNSQVSILRNTSSIGSISFAPKVVFPLGNEPFGSAVGDLDGDGKPDLAIVDNVDDVVSVLVNASTPGTINFETKVDFATEANPRHIIISDLDGDGIVDVATGNFSNTISILRNTSTVGNLSFDAKIDLPSTEFGSIRTIAVGDFDGDGKRDLTTANASDPNLSVYRNNSSPGVIDFDPHIDLMTGSSPSSVLISDFNGDGRADLAAVNTSNGSASISIFKNNSSVGSIDFANQVELPIESGSISSWIDAADIDGDGRTDFISSKSSPAPFSFSVFRNNPIIPPLSLDTSLPLANATSVDRNAIIELDFDADVDLLSVNNNSANANEVYDDNITIVGNLSGQIEGIFTVGADNSIIVFDPSNNFKAGEKITVTVTSNVLGTGGEDAAPGSFVFSAASEAFKGAFIERDLGILGLAQGSFDWGDYDGDGNLDVITVGYDEDYNNTVAIVYRNNGGVFTDIGASITGVYFSDVDWGDYDNDGDLDLVIAGETDGGVRLTTIYQNNAGLFSDIGAGLEGADYASVEWGDYDNDGDLDLIVAGRTSFSPTTASSTIYNNEGGIFTDINAGLPGLYLGSAEWGDYDGDGDLDILLAGFDDASGRFSVIYDNNDGTFSDHLAGLPGIARGNATWGDYDNDGDLDILLVGDGSALTYSTIFNNNAGVFTDIIAEFPTTSDGGGTWADYDGDGLLDVMITGFDYSSSDEITDIFRNNGSDSFTNLNARLNPIPDLGRAQFIDYDGDGDLDLLTAGEIGSTPFTSATLYENTTFPIFYSEGAGAFDTPALWNSTENGSGFNPIASNFTDEKTDFIIQNGDVITAASAAISMNNFTIEDGGIYQNGSQDIVVFGSTNISGEFSDAITAGESTFFGTLIIESTGSFTTSGATSNTFRFYDDITNRGTFNLTSSVSWNLEADLTILNESSSAMSFSNLNSGIGSINANLIVADSPGGANVLLRSTDYIRMADNTTLRNELGDYPINSRILEIAELRALSGSANFENASNAIVLLRDDNLGTFDAINFDFTATDNLVRYFSDGDVLAVDHYHIALTAGATSALLGSINVFGDLTINNGNALDASGNNITIAGDWINSNGLAGFLPGSGIVSFNGSNMDPQIISGETNFNNVVINNTGSSRKITAGNSISIASSLTLTSGVLEVTDGNVLSLSAAATASGAFGISEMIQLATTATVRKYFDTDGSFTFPIGTANIYNETSLTLTPGTNYNGAAGSRYVELNLIGAEEPNVLIPGFALTKYWIVNSVNLDNISGSLALTYDGLDATNGDENNYLAASYDGNWNTNSNVDAAANTFSFSFSGAADLNANYTAGELASFLAIPTISSFTPTNVGAGKSVTITGTNFDNASIVSFGGVNAALFTVVSSTTITATVGSGSSGNISITTPNGTVSLTGFNFIPAPIISSFSPTNAGIGDTITIVGSNFTDANLVSFGGTAATFVNVISDTEIIAVLGNGSSGVVSVDTPGGTVSFTGFQFIPAPIISSFSPATAAIGDTITIIGSNFTGANLVSFGGTAATFVNVVSDTEIIAVLGNGSSGMISVDTPGGNSSFSGFQFISAPTIESFAPAIAATGDTISIIGTNFTDASSVSFGGTAAASFIIVSDTQIEAIVGLGSSGDLTISTSGGTSTFTGFTFANPLIEVLNASETPVEHNQTAVVNLGATLQGSPLSQAFSIKNEGNSDLSISSIISSNDAFKIVDAPNSVAAGANANFIIEFEADTLGTYISEITITNNTPAIPLFNFQVSAENTVLNIINNDNDSIIISNQSVDLGSTFVNIDIDKTFNIENVSSNSSIDVTSITVDNSAFQILNAPSSIAPSSSAEFTVRLLARTVGSYTGNVIINTTLNEFTFSLIGIVLAEAGTEIKVYNVITPNGDGRHDILRIENISEYLNNKVSIFNRLGNRVFEVNGYNNDSNFFSGVSDNGEELLTGNYYYVIDKGNGDKRLTGFLIIKR